jgi:hypothetical protein
MIKRCALLAIAILVIAGILPAPSPASALSGSEFRAGRIIDDSVFFDSTSMSADEIQDFLNAKVPVCDTNGDQMHTSGQTRRAYSASRGYSPPFTCLKDYRQDVPSRAWEPQLCDGISPGNKKSSQIIYEVSRSCGINPRVLLVLLQKEQSLVTDDWPWSIQYRSATGYGCPDTAPCDEAYYGFFNQVWSAARQFKRYARDADSFNFKAGRASLIQYNPNTSCGSSSVFIENQATANLYNYTPYQPNASALNNLYGTGDSCGAYGNRNFWRMYNDWFGEGATLQGPIGDTVYRLYKPSNNDHYYTARDTDRDFVKKNLGFKEDGPAFKTSATQEPGMVPVYALYQGRITDYFYTIDGPDRYWAIVLAGYKEMGIAFYAYPTAQPGTKAVHRLWHGGRGDHFYTTSEDDRIYCLVYAGYLYDRVVFYVPE